MKRFVYIFFLILSLTCGVLNAQSQTDIKGIINKYVKVTTVVNALSVNVSSSIDFAQGDTVMIVQMKGAKYSSDDPNVIDDPVNMGKYELTVVNTVSGNTITFNSPLKIHIMLRNQFNS
ncbi:MAG: hypothetical protein HC905_04730 [Bacteroidales bacterium]|nr:hypothetical protein [Bacteroidales bacterium]